MTGDELGELEHDLDRELERLKLEEWIHCGSPQSNAAVYAQLVEHLAAERERWNAARRRHDHAGADAVLADVRDLTALCATACEGLERQRDRFAAADREKLAGPVLAYREEG